MRPAIIIITCLIFSSCATILNSKTDMINIVANEPVNISIANDTLTLKSNTHTVSVERSKDSLEISAFSGQKCKTINLSSANSFAYWLNLYPITAWTGFIIERNNPKRYSYPNTIYIDLNEKEDDYLTYKPLDSIYSGYTNILKITPLKLVSMFNSGIEIGYEKRLNNSFSTQFIATYLFPASVWDLGYDYKPQIKGIQLALEEKYYWKKSAPLGPYLSIEFNYLINNYRDIGFFGAVDRFSDTTNYSEVYTDTIGINKTTYSLNFKLGYQYIKKRFSLDLYFGLGARYKDVYHFDKIKPEDEMEMPRHLNAYYINNLDGKYWTISIPLNFKLGWTF